MPITFITVIYALLHLRQLRHLQKDDVGSCENAPSTVSKAISSPLGPSRHSPQPRLPIRSGSSTRNPYRQADGSNARRSEGPTLCGPSPRFAIADRFHLGGVFDYPWGLRAILSPIISRGVRALGDDTVEYLANEVWKTLYGFMMQSADEMDLDQPPAQLGLDSLVGIELRNWCRQQLGREVCILEIMQSTLRDMAKRAVDCLVSKHC
ncbi:hypothetical protein V1527DRAFT_515437 [Lipomyces starkeyi]